MVKAIQLVIAEEVEIPSETKEENQPQPPGFHLKLTPEGKRFLETLPEGVHIVGFTGDARQGKSTLACNMLRHLDPSIMNRVTKSEELFEARAGSDAVTSGIWIWPEVLRSEKYNNELFVVIDTEGTDKGDDNLTAQLTAVTCFLVSQLVLHVKSELGNSGLARLAALTHILGEASSADETSRAAVFPDLMVCARSVEDSWLVDQGFGEMDASGLADVKFGTNEVHEKGDKYLENKVFNTSLQDGHDGDRVQVLKMLKEQRFCFSTVAERRDRALLMVGKEAEKAGVNRVWSEFDEESPFSKSYHAAMDRIISTTTKSPVLTQSRPILLESMLDFFSQQRAFPVNQYLLQLQARSSAIVAEMKSSLTDKVAALDCSSCALLKQQSNSAWVRIESDLKQRLSLYPAQLLTSCCSQLRGEWQRSLAPAEQRARAAEAAAAKERELEALRIRKLEEERLKAAQKAEEEAKREEEERKEAERKEAELKEAGRRAVNSMKRAARKLRGRFGRF